ncbi:MAG: aldehyde dehydrogenase family protein, partial [Hyphomicrobium sp.]
MNAHVTLPADAALNDILARQRAAFLRDGAPSLAARKADLAKLKRAFKARLADFETALNADFEGRSSHETAILEGMALVGGVNYLRRNLARWMRPEARHVEMHFLPGRARVVYQPLGVIGIMSPWNFPVGLSLMPLAT